MTEEQKKTADCEMYNLWKQFIYEETMKGEERDYRHLDFIIRNNSFIKKYMECDNRVCSYWIFILCDGEFGYFDGYRYIEEIPVSLAKLLDIENYLKTSEFVNKNGNYFLN